MIVRLLFIVILFILRVYGIIFQKINIYGNIGTYGYYFVYAGIGQPSQPHSLIVDTGSSIVSFTCAPCNNCSKHLNNPYNSSTSLTYEIPNDCLTKDGCQFIQKYSEGSLLSGSFISDLVSFYPFNSQSTFRHPKIGCHTAETNLFLNQAPSGIVGLLYIDQVSSKLQKSLLKSWRKHTNQHLIFSICFSEVGGHMYLGGYNSSNHFTFDQSATRSRHKIYDVGTRLDNSSNKEKILRFTKSVGFSKPLKEQPKYTNNQIYWETLHTEQFYNFHINNFSLVFEDQIFFVTQGPIKGVLDSGSTYTLLPKNLFHKLKSILKDYAAVEDMSETCFEINEFSDFFHFPIIQINSLIWYSYSYLYKDEKNIWCLAFGEHSRDYIILGANFFKHREVIFDLDSSRVGFADSICDNNKKLPDNKELVFEISDSIIKGTEKNPSNSTSKNLTDLYDSALDIFCRYFYNTGYFNALFYLYLLLMLRIYMSLCAIFPGI